MVDPLIIVFGIIFVLIVLIIIVGLVYYNRDVPPSELITNFGLTIKTPNGLYMSMENIITEGTGGTGTNEQVFPIMTLTTVLQGQNPIPTQGWMLERTENNPNPNIVTFFNPINSGYINYTVDGNGALVDGIIRTDSITKPPDPIVGNKASFLGWFEMTQNNNITTFKSLFPSSIKGNDQYLIPGSLGQLILNPNLIPITIGISNNNNNEWIVG